MARVDPPSEARLVCFKSETAVVVTTRKERGYFDEFVSVLSKDHHLCLTQVLFRQYSFILRHILFRMAYWKHCEYLVDDINSVSSCVAMSCFYREKRS